MHGVEISEKRDLFGSGAGLRQIGGGFWPSTRYIGWVGFRTIMEPRRTIK